MPRMMKFLTLILVVAFALVACRQAPEEEATEPEPVAAEPTEAPAEEEEAVAEEEEAVQEEEEVVEEEAEEEEPMEEMGPIKIAFLGPLTGGAAALGQEMLGFAKITVDIFNEQTGLNVELVEGDTEINADTGRIVAEQLAADDDIYVVVGPAGSQVCEAAQPVFEAAGLAHVTPTCTATLLTNPGTPTFFRPIPNDADQSMTIAGVMLDTLGVSSVYMVDDQSTYSVNLDDEVEAILLDAGVAIERASVTQEETDFSSVATAAINFGADAVFFPSQILAQEGTLAVQLREQGYEGVYFLADGGFAPDWVAAAGDAAEGTYVTVFMNDPNNEAGMAEYNARYTEEYNEPFGSFGGATAHSTFVALNAVETCADAGDLSRACVVDALTNMDLETTPMGVAVSFGPGNQAEGGFLLFQVQDGAFVNLPPGEMGIAAGPEPLMVDVPLKIAFLGPLTGGAASLGQEMLGFAKITVDIFNERTGLNVEVVEGDTEINADTGRIVAEQLVADDDLYVVVGPAGSQVCEATQPVFEAAGLAHVTPTCTATLLTNPGTPTFFRPIPNDADQSKTVADVMLNTLGVESVYMVDDQSTYSVNLDDEVEAILLDAGVTIERASVTQEETDFSSVATAAISFGADAVFFPSQILAQEGTLAVQLREQGYEGVYFLADGGFAPDWVEAAGDAAEGTYVTVFMNDPNNESGMAEYNARYTEEYGENFGSFGGATAHTTFVALNALETCVRADDISRACIVDALTNIDLATTPMGVAVRFGEGNQAEGGFLLFQVQDGAFVLVDN